MEFLTSRGRFLLPSGCWRSPPRRGWIAIAGQGTLCHPPSARHCEPPWNITAVERKICRKRRGDKEGSQKRGGCSSFDQAPKLAVDVSRDGLFIYLFVCWF